MKLKEIAIGTVFNIENTPSYPKLRIDGGYVDMRDEIVNKSGNCDEREVFEMDAKSIAEKFEDTEESVQEWIKQTKEKYLTPLQ